MEDQSKDELITRDPNDYLASFETETKPNQKGINTVLILLVIILLSVLLLKY